MYSSVLVATTLCCLAMSGTPLAAADDISAVITPAIVDAGSVFSVEWAYRTDSAASGTTGDLNPFDIELRSCGEAGRSCENAGCGDAFLALCAREGGCMDSDGSFDVTVPNTVTAGDYVVSVTYIGSSGWPSAASYSTSSSSSGGNSGSGTGAGAASSVTACSSAFSVEVAEGAAVVEGEPVLTATAVSSELSPGEAFTAEWEYDDGNGDASGTFEVNLYSCADGACVDGRWVIMFVLCCVLRICVLLASCFFACAGVVFSFVSCTEE